MALDPEPAVFEGDELLETLETLEVLEVLEGAGLPVVCGLVLLRQLFVELLPTPRKSLLLAKFPLPSCGMNSTVIPRAMLAFQLYESVAAEGTAMLNVVPCGMRPWIVMG